jgi:excisionase family DNA binding protein
MEPTKKIAVSVREAAAMLGISPRSIQNYVRVKTLAARKIGRRTVIRVRDLEAFLRADQPSPISKPSRIGNGTLTRANWSHARGK